MPGRRMKSIYVACVCIPHARHSSYERDGLRLADLANGKYWSVYEALVDAAFPLA